MAPRFEVVENEPTPEQPDRASAFAADALMLGLKVLSQRALAGLRAGFTLLSVASAWWLWSVTPDPSPTQIASLTIYALFILAANYIVRRI